MQCEQVHWCAYGAPWRRSTSIISHLVSLDGQLLQCPGCSHHRRFRVDSHLAARYPKRLAQKLVELYENEYRRSRANEMLFLLSAGARQHHDALCDYGWLRPECLQADRPECLQWDPGRKPE
eukprot:6454955-Amphidinium_carterae.1